ncbi:unnamed protein product [Symbiodinium pilosum]|uniref:Uncharacterized protein n=1 Tax=Symbiodinium pilosum TaxID=2952 RepID=A0A812X976_SYMPI|nr:unnamed protein product [Symbiodinium pilosum]
MAQGATYDELVRGWDPFTACVLFAEVGNGWLSVAILKRMSAVVKFVCKSAAAPSLYMVYSFSHFRQHHFEWQTFLPILAMTTCIYLYAEPPCFGSVGSAKGHQNHQNTQTWPDQYKAKRGQSAQG